MKAAPVILLISILLFPFSTFLHAQDTLQYRKLYLHTDREQYFLGDTLWYKAYYLDGQTNKFVPGLISLYVDLFDQAGKSVSEQVVAIDNGAAAGAIDIPGTIEPGKYVVRAFTDFQRRIGEDAFFHKTIEISKLESFVEGADQHPPVKAAEIDVAFLPEGGLLLEGQDNTVGIKAIDQYGNGIQIQGEIVDGRGRPVKTFTTSYQGMTSIQLVPEKGETYTARVTDYPDYQYAIDDIIEEGIKIEFDRESGNDLQFEALTNSASLLGKTYYFAISHRGEVLFHQRFIPRDYIFPITVQKDALPAGINRMVLLDERLLPVSERLYFSDNYEINEIKIKADQKSYETRSQVRLRLSDGTEMGNKSWSNLSMVVLDEFATSRKGPSMNIFSWLLLDSELKGQIESPQDYFVDDAEITSKAKLDLLMMTQGWSRYVWNNPRESLAGAAKDKEGFTISGAVQKVLGRKPVDEGTIELKIYNNDFMHTDEMELDQDGRFVFRDVNFMDTAAVFIQARNKRDKLAYEVHLNPIFNPFPVISMDNLALNGNYEYKQPELYQRQYDMLQAWKEYALSTGGFFIEEVSITEHRREPEDGHFRIYEKPSNSLQITERDITYLNIIDYMQGRFAGVSVSKDGNISIRGPSSFSPRPPLLILDGLPVSKEILLSIPMAAIDRVEVLKNPSETAIFGTRGGSGVVSVFTKRGGFQDYSAKYIPGTIAEKLAGYSSRREFYTPTYTEVNINSERPDHRIVQYWEPNIFTEKGKAMVSFFSSDDISRYRIYVEGITREGKICLGTGEIEVDRRNDRLAEKRGN